MSTDKIQGVTEAFSPRRNLKTMFVRPRGYDAALDGIRGVGIVWTTGYHVVVLAPYFTSVKLDFSRLSWFSRAFTYGDLAVDFFFVLSGFLIGRLLLTEARDTGRISFGHFYAWRALRILPVYYGALALWSALGAPNGDTVWTNLLFLNNFVTLPRQALPTAWSLAIEEQFYLVMPLAIMWLSRFRRGRIVAILASAVAVSCLIRGVAIGLNHVPLRTIQDYMTSPPESMSVLYTYHDALYDKLYTRCGCLVLGVLAAHVHLCYPAELTRFFSRRAVGLVVMVAAALPYAVLSFFHGSLVHMMSYRNAAGLIVATGLVVALNDSGWAGKTLRFLSGWRPFYTLSQLSYSAYLLQLMIISHYYVASLAGGAPDLTAVIEHSFLPIFALVFGAAALSYLTIERPAMNLRGVFFGRKKTSRSATPALTPAAETTQSEGAE